MIARDGLPDVRENKDLNKNETILTSEQYPLIHVIRLFLSRPRRAPAWLTPFVSASNPHSRLNGDPSTSFYFRGRYSFSSSGDKTKDNRNIAVAENKRIENRLSPVLWNAP